MTEIIENQYLTFGIDGEMFAVPVSTVREVLEYIKPTKLPKTVDFLKGIINVRGTGIPVVDLRSRFAMAQIDITQDTAIIVIEIRLENALVTIGAIADEVYEVVEIDQQQLEPAPRFGSKIDTSFIQAVGKRDEQFIIILDLNKAFSDQEAGILAETATA